MGRKAIVPEIAHGKYVGMDFFKVSQLGMDTGATGVDPMMQEPQGYFGESQDIQELLMKEASGAVLTPQELQALDNFMNQQSDARSGGSPE